MEKKKILYISSVNPLKGPGALSMDHYNMLLDAGYEIDFLTKFPVIGHPEIKYVLKKPINRFIDKIKRFKFYYLKKYKKPIGQEGPYFYFYLKEDEPPVSIKKVLKQIDKKYDLIIIYFWQGLLTYKTVDKIFDKIGNPKVLFINADYSTMTGGCHFFCQCRNYENGCGRCPMINSKNPNDFTAWNVKYRKKIIGKIRPYVTVNGYTKDIFKKSSIFKDKVSFLNSTITLNLEKFHPGNRIIGLRKYNLPEDKFIILFGSQNIYEERKGMKYLFDSLKLLYNRLSEIEKNNILLVSIGNSNGVENFLPAFKQTHLGFVSTNELPDIYSMSNLFISPSINDPGPSMVNQSIACGTPVVAFEMGTALDVIKDQGSGICVPLKDVRAMSFAIEKIYRMEVEEYGDLRKQTRQTAEKFHSKQTFKNRIKYILEN